jgi:hypothetical protein
VQLAGAVQVAEGPSTGAARSDRFRSGGTALISACRTVQVDGPPLKLNAERDYLHSCGEFLRSRARERVNLSVVRI